MIYDWIFVGGGLANGLAAYRLLDANPALSILVVEKGGKLGGDHTWSFHASDVESSARRWLEPFIVGKWSSHEVWFPSRHRALDSGYLSIRSDRFHRILSERLGARVLYRRSAQRVEPDGVMLDDGSWCAARGVVDGRGFAEETGSEARTGYQNFFGQDVKLSAPHGLAGPVLMDARCEQLDGFRFFYLLPWSEDRLLIEDTRYCDTAGITPSQARVEIERYAAARGWAIEKVEREEAGALPIPFAAPRSALAEGTLALGVRAGLFHPTTGYSLPDAVRTADLFHRAGGVSAREMAARLNAYRSRAVAHRGFYRYLNRMLFFGGVPQNRYRILERFYGLPADVIRRFYAARLTWGDRVRILSGRPPISIGRAFRLLFAAELRAGKASYAT